MVGNKLDLADQRSVSKEEAKMFAKRMGIIYVETSAIQNNGVNEVFEKLINGKK